MFQLLIGGLETNAKGLPKWMTVKDIDHLSSKEKSRIVSSRVLQNNLLSQLSRMTRKTL